MTQDNYLDRRPVNENNLRALEALNPDQAEPDNDVERDEEDGDQDETTEEAGS